MRQPNKVSGQAKNEGDNANRKVANPTNLAHAHTAPRRASAALPGERRADRCLRRGEHRSGLHARLRPPIDLVVDVCRTDHEITLARDLRRGLGRSLLLPKKAPRLGLPGLSGSMMSGAMPPDVPGAASTPLIRTQVSFR